MVYESIFWGVKADSSYGLTSLNGHKNIAMIPPKWFCWLDVFFRGNEHSHQWGIRLRDNTLSNGGLVIMDHQNNSTASFPKTREGRRETTREVSSFSVNHI